MNIFIQIITRILGFSITVFIFWFLSWKGLIGAAIGMSLILYLFMTNNTQLWMIVEMLGGNRERMEKYQREVFQDDKEKTE